MKTHGIAKLFLICALCVLFALSAFCGCHDAKTPVEPDPPAVAPEEPSGPEGPEIPPEPTVPEDPDAEEAEQAFAEAVAAYKALVATIKNNFTITTDSYTAEVDGDKMRLTDGVTEQFFAIEDDKTMHYTTGSDGWQKEEDAEFDLNGYIAQQIEKLSGECISYDKETDKLYRKDLSAIKFGNGEIEITFENGSGLEFSAIGKTTVTLPTIEVFDAMQHIPEILTNLEPVFTRMKNSALGMSSTISEVFNVYLKQGESGKVDTIGAVVGMTSNDGGASLAWVELILKNQTSDLIMKDLMSKKFICNANNSTANLKYRANISTSDQQTYKNEIDILFNTLFGDGVKESATWSGFSINRGVGSNGFNLYLFKDNTIMHKYIGVSTSGETLTIKESIQRNFMNQSESSTTWQKVKDDVLKLPNGSLDIWSWNVQQAQTQR